MKTRAVANWTLGLVLAGWPLVGGCGFDSIAAEEQPEAAKTTTTNAPALAVVPVPAAEAAQADANTPAEPPLPKAVVPDKAAAEQKPVPSNLALSPALREVVKMANAGIDDSVMLTFVSNSASTFNLSSDQIIYLNDLGVPGPVVTAMIQRDQQILAGAGAAATSTMSMTAVPTNPAPPIPDPNAAPPQQYAPIYATAPQVEVVQPPPVAPPPGTVDTSSFHDTLAPYGNWVNVDGYGSCWQPTVTVINADWAPYSDAGRWLYTDDGWYWASDYSWGGIPFHYGRWFRHPRWGWCWWPDTCWGPSWVTWRYSGDYCGWAPLPPLTYWTPGIGFTYYGGSVAWSAGFGLGWNCFTFVPWRRFNDHHPQHYALRGHDRPDAFRHSEGAPHGLPFDKAQRYAHGEIRRVQVRDAMAGGGGGRSVRPDRVAQEGGRTVVYRPHPTGASPTAASLAAVGTGAGGRGGSAMHGPDSKSPGSATHVTSIRPGGSLLVARDEPAASPQPARSEFRSVVIKGDRPAEVKSQVTVVEPASTPTVTVKSTRPNQVTTGPTSNWQNRPATIAPIRPALSPKATSSSFAPQPRTGIATPTPRVAPAPAPVVPSVATSPRPSYSAPVAPARPNVYTAPAVRSGSYSAPSVRPSYTPPTVRSAPSFVRPAPSYSAPAISAPSRPQYSAPAAAAPAVRSSPTPAPSASASPARPSNSGNSGGRRNDR